MTHEMLAMNKCIFVDASCELSIRDMPETYHPQEAQALVKVEYSGINPADLNHPKDLGMSNNVCGYEICGTVIEAGPNCRYAIGDVIFGSNYPGRSRPPYYGGHQNYAILESNSMSTKLTGSLPRTHAAAMPVMVRTAADALMNIFEIPFPAIGFNGPSAKGGIFIWGGASSVGTATIQLAKAMEINPIFTTASPANHQALLELGATQCFDYRDTSVVHAVRDAAKKEGFPIKYILDTVCKNGNPGTLEQCESIAAAPDVVFAGTLPQIGVPHWKMVIASRGIDVPVPGGSKADPARESRLEQAVIWAMTNYGKNFRIPRINIVKGEERSIQAIKDVNEGKISFAKIVIEHPL